MANEIRNTFELDINQYTQAINSAIGSMQTYDKATEEATKDTANLSGESGSAAKKVRELGAASDVSAGKLKKVGEAAGELGKELGGAIEQATGLTGSFGRIGQAAINLGRTVVTALGPIGVAIGVISVALAGLAKIFFDTERGSEKLDRALSILSAVFERVIGLVQEFTFFIADAFTSPQETVRKLWKAIETNLANRLTGLIDQFKALGDVIAGVFTLDTERIDAGLIAFSESTIQVVTGVDDAVGKATRGFEKFGAEISKAADTGLRIEKLKEQLEDLALVQAKREGELNRTIAEQLDIARDLNRTNQERKAAAEAAIQAQNELASLAAQQNKLEVERLTLQQSLNDTSIEGQIELAKLKAQGDQIEAERLNANRRAQAIVRGIDKASADAAVANAQRVTEARKKAEEEASEAAAREAERRAQIQGAANEQLTKIRQERELAALTEAERQELLVREAARKELEITRKLFNDLLSITDEDNRAEVRAQQAEAILAIEQNKADRLLEIEKERSEKQEEQDEQETERRRQALVQDFERRTAIVEQGAQTLAGIVATAVQNPQEAAKQAAKAVLDVAFAQLQAQTAIWSAQIIGGSLATPQSIATGGAAGVAQFTAILAILQGALAVARGAITGAFHDGGLVGRDGGTKMHGGRDGFLTRVERGEYVMPTNKTAQYMPYLEAMRDGTFERLYSLRMPTSNDSSTHTPKWSDRGIVSALGGVGSMSEQRKQTVLLSQVASALNRGHNKRYLA
jgi:hypothetical protein